MPATLMTLTRRARLSVLVLSAPNLCLPVVVFSIALADEND